MNPPLLPTLVRSWSYAFRPWRADALVDDMAIFESQKRHLKFLALAVAVYLALSFLGNAASPNPYPPLTVLMWSTVFLIPALWSYPMALGTTGVASGVSLVHLPFTLLGIQSLDGFFALWVLVATLTAWWICWRHERS